MVKIKVDYIGDLKCTVEHVKSGQKILTDAPEDNNGKAEYISPTDMMAGSIGSCIATIIGIKSRDMDVDMKGLSIIVSKEMQNKPYRRIKRLNIDISFPCKLTDKQFAIFSNVLKTCPVTRSLHPEIEIVPKFNLHE
jgi:uncharacterized OsmC-like protein